MRAFTSGRLKETEPPGHGSSKSERDASLILLVLRWSAAKGTSHTRKGLIAYVCPSCRPEPTSIDAYHACPSETVDQKWKGNALLEGRHLLCPAQCRSISPRNSIYRGGD